MMKFNNVARALKPLTGKRMFATATRSTVGKNTGNKEFSSLSVDYESDPENGGLDPSVKYTSVAATSRQLCDFELIANGGFAQLDGFLNKAESESVCANYRLTNGELWPIPINMDIDEKTKAHLEDNDGKLLLTDANGVERGILHVEDIWKADKKMEAELVYGGNPDHCEIINLNENINEYYVGGQVEVLSLPEYEDYKELRRTPKEVKQFFQDNKWDKVVAFQTRNPMHFAHIELTKLAAERIGAKLFLNPVVGPTKPGDIPYDVRMKCYHAVLDEYPKDHVLLNTLPLAMRMGGPREAMLHALIRRNHGATHFIIGRDHAGPGSDSSGNDIYGAYEARDFLEEHKEEVGIEPVPFEEMVYLEKEQKYFPRSAVPEGVKPLKISGTDVRRMLKTGEEIPSWFSPPRVVKILREASSPKA
ncbi:Sulfate adenylyltransferase [Seminavis robusta]|uniref:sulfate adenylyltransferase n=1 Tax=Seminavis robusta TaxID=568900 RepID=A0A9N8H7K0_9STRA|nr:Sulfate adenylyltransferase [Seminavis robusta]|eukprot:Sro142_g066380.1 Sulfate adenylyltransferase (420) ;mRNA; f:88802-90146